MASRPNALIIGGGIGGLFAANALIGQELRVSVYEQASALGEVGAGVYVTPNAVRHLERVGLGAAVEKWGPRVGPGSCYFRHDGTLIAPVQVSDASGWNATFGMHRADFVEFLAANLPAGSSIPATVLSASSRTATSPALNSLTAPPPRPKLWLPPTEYTPNCAPTSFRHRSPSFTPPFLTEVWSRASVCRTGRWTAGKCGRSVQAFPGLPCLSRNDGQLRRFRADR